MAPELLALQTSPLSLLRRSSSAPSSCSPALCPFHFWSGSSAGSHGSPLQALRVRVPARCECQLCGPLPLLCYLLLAGVAYLAVSSATAFAAGTDADAAPGRDRPRVLLDEAAPSQRRKARPILGLDAVQVQDGDVDGSRIDDGAGAPPHLPSPPTSLDPESEGAEKQKEAERREEVGREEAGGEGAEGGKREVGGEEEAVSKDGGGEEGETEEGGRSEAAKAAAVAAHSGRRAAAERLRSLSGRLGRHGRLSVAPLVGDANGTSAGGRLQELRRAASGGSADSDLLTAQQRQAQVVATFRHAWEGYKVRGRRRSTLMTASSAAPWSTDTSLHLVVPPPSSLLPGCNVYSVLSMPASVLCPSSLFPLSSLPPPSLPLSPFLPPLTCAGANMAQAHAFGYDELQPLSGRGVDSLGGLGATIVDALDTAIVMGLADVATEAGRWIQDNLLDRFATKGQVLMLLTPYSHTLCLLFLSLSLFLFFAAIVPTPSLHLPSSLPPSTGAVHDRGGAPQVNLFETTIRVLGGLLSAYHLLGGTENATVLAEAGLERRGSPLAPSQLGGAKFAAAYAGPPPAALLTAATDLGDRLLAAFTDSPSAVPLSDVLLSQRRGQAAGGGGDASTAEVASLQLEFWYLSAATGDPKYGNAAMAVLEHLGALSGKHAGQFRGANIRLGSRGDSYYEYLLKVHMQQGGTNGTAGMLRAAYDEAMDGVRAHLVAKSKPGGLTFVGELPGGPVGELHPKMDHLVCFLAGTLALGATDGLPKSVVVQHAGSLSDRQWRDLLLAELLCETCYQMYDVTATRLAPEIAYFNTVVRPKPSTPLLSLLAFSLRFRLAPPSSINHFMPHFLSPLTAPMDIDVELMGGRPDAMFARDIHIQPADRHNLLRPETVESVFYLHRITKDPKYRDWGWAIFKAFEANARVESGGYASLGDVTMTPPPQHDKMETFFLGETLKYLYLLFADDSVLPLDAFVFNTEAHPLPIFTRVNASAAVAVLRNSQ
eukprot:SM000340S12928  [mRNA]  locus=s340:370:4401:- [translate_table: standard]